MSNEIVRSTETVPPPPKEYPIDQVVFNPPIDIFETAEGLVLQADLPGVATDSLELQIQDNKLSLFGKVTLSIPSDARLIHQEYQVGHFLRSFILYLGLKSLKNSFSTSISLFCSDLIGFCSESTQVPPKKKKWKN